MWFKQGNSNVPLRKKHYKKINLIDMNEVVKLKC